MSESEHDPHVLVSARANESPKIVDLPSDRARWGWVVMLGKAKLQRPPGRFASRRLLDAVLGDYRRYVPDYIRVGILEEMDGGEVVVHDFEVNQSRTQAWRRRVGLTNGHGNLSGNDEGNNGETEGKPLARVPASQSQSQSSFVVPEGGPGGDDGRADLEAFLAVRYRIPTPAQRRLMDGYIQTFDVTGPERAAKLILANPDDPIGALKADLTAFRQERVAQLTEKVAQPRQKGSGLSTVNAELAHLMTVNPSLLTAAHNNGAHADTPDPRCRYCRERGDAA